MIDWLRAFIGLIVVGLVLHIVFIGAMTELHISEHYLKCFVE